MGYTASSQNALDALVAESRQARAETYALLDALRAANLRLHELVASHARLERRGDVRGRPISSDSALDRLKMSLLAEPKSPSAWLPRSAEAIADDARSG